MNLNGNLQFQSLREFAVGFCVRNYKINETVVRNRQASYEFIDIHCMLCMVTMRKMNVDRGTTFDVQNWLNKYIPLFHNVSLNLIGNITKLFLTVLIEMLTDKLQRPLMDVIGVIANLLTRDYLISVEYNRIWRELTDLK